MKKGDTLEAKYSALYHQQFTPALISSLFLRSQNLGQIDIAYMTKNKKNQWIFNIIETKCSLYPSKIQLSRLRRTQDYLSRVLDSESKLEVKFCQKGNHSLSF